MVTPLFYDLQGPPHQTAPPLPLYRGSQEITAGVLLLWLSMVTQPGCFPWILGTILPLADSHAAHF